MDLRSQSVDAFAAECTLDELYGLGAEHYRVIRENIRSVTREQTAEVAGRYFSGVASVTVQVGPEVAV
jgi:predicted Zn-dependent peptidase